MSPTEPQGAASVFRKPTRPPAPLLSRRSSGGRGDRRFFIPPSVASSLPHTVLEQLASLSPDRQRAFVWRYRSQAKTSVVAFIVLLPGWHYLYLRQRRLQVLFWLTCGGLGLWWLVDLFRVRRLVQDHNRTLAGNVMRALWG
jgi:hypothetical protein